MAKGKKLVIAMTDAAQFWEELKQEKADLMAQAEEAHARYLTCAEQVDSLQFEIFTRCGLMQAYTKAGCLNNSFGARLATEVPAERRSEHETRPYYTRWSHARTSDHDEI
jgi:hypothetical protein